MTKKWQPVEKVIDNINLTADTTDSIARHNAERCRRSLMEEFNFPLPQVQCKWLRRSITLSLSPVLIILGALSGAWAIGKWWFEDCW